LIIDDEKPARDLLENYANRMEELSVVAVLDNALAAKKIIDRAEVDILLTDIQMDGLTGIDLVKILRNPPVTIFTTAYSEYALEGYALDVIDYLVKPISFQRFCRSIDKAIELIGFRQKAPVSSPASATPPPSSDFFFVRTNRKLVKVNYRDILFLQSYGEYVKLYTQDDVILALQTTNYMEEVLPSEDFVRIHRSHIINVNHIQEVMGNQVQVEQHQLVVSKRMKESFMAVLQAKGIV
ncbi:MAG: LytTR family DNA-binding domain-containing protein, partial [Bacteroidota bacterium]